MHLTHSQLSLLTALLGGLAKKSTLAVCGHLFFTPAPGGKIILTATDLELSFFWPVQQPATSLQHPVSCPIGWFLKAARSVPKDGHLEVRATGAVVCLLPSKGPSLRSPEASLNIADAPPFNTTGCTRGGWLSAATMQAAVKALPFASTDQTRYVLNGALIQASGHLVATDGRRLAHSPTPDTRLPQDIIVPTRHIAVLTALTARNGLKSPVWLDGSDQTDGFGAPDASRLLTQVGDCHVQLSLISGNYPRWQQVVPMEFTTLVTLRDDFLDDYTALLRTSSTEKDVNVKLTLHPGAGRKVTAELYHRGKNGMNPLGDPLPAGTHACAKPFAIAFNARFFLDVVNFSGPRLRLQDDISPATGGSPDAAQTVLMPMRLAEAVAAA